MNKINYTKDDCLEINPGTLVGVLMGSQSDWSTMQHCCTILQHLEILHQVNIISAHRTPSRLWHYGNNAIDNGLKVIIAGAGGAAHLPGMIAAMTVLPVIGVPVETQGLGGQDSLYSIVQMPFGTPVACMKIGISGAKNAGLMAARILSLNDSKVCNKLQHFRCLQTQQVYTTPQ